MGKLTDRNRLDTLTVDAVLAALEKRSSPVTDPVWSAGWNAAMDFVAKAIVQARSQSTPDILRSDD